MHQPGLLLSLALSSFSLACSDRVVAGDEEAGDTESPFEPGQQYAECADEFECVGAWCLSPAGEAGFCTIGCASVDDCEFPDVGTAEPTCLSVGADAACALDCGGDKDCPAGMRCEQVEADGDPRSICF